MEQPTVSIGLAVRNGDRYLGEAIASILGQTFTDLELIICDNASTDRTEEICRKAAESDERVRYFRNERNIGGANNENSTYRRARGRYFRWAAHDDVLAPTLIERCANVLDEDASVVLCHSAVVFIDESDAEIGRRSAGRDAHARPSKTFAMLVDDVHTCEETYGLIRSTALSATGLQRNYTDSDRTLLAHLSLLGRFVEIPEYLFYRRLHPHQSTEAYPDRRDRMRWFGDEYANRISLPFWSQLRHYLWVIRVAPINGGEKLRCSARMVQWVFEYRHWRSLGKDMLLAMFGLCRRCWMRRPSVERRRVTVECGASSAQPQP